MTPTKDTINNSFSEWLDDLLQELQRQTYTGDDAEKTIRKDPDHIGNRDEAKTAILKRHKEELLQVSNKVLDELLSEMPETKPAIMHEPVQGIDQLWLDGRSVGLASGYNQAIETITDLIKRKRQL